MIAVGCAIRVLGGGLHAYGLSVFFLPVTQELGLTRTATSLVFSLARAQGALEGPVAGYCIDRYGPRPVIAIAIVLAGIGYLLLAGVHSYAMLLVVYMGVSRSPTKPVSWTRPWRWRTLGSSANAPWRCRSPAGQLPLAARC
jgi:MFS family permease